MKWCTSFGTRLGVQVRDFSACFNYFTKWDLTTSWYLEITSSLVFNLLEEWIEDITWPRRDTKFLFECWKTFHEWAPLSNCFMMNLKLQNAAQRRFVFVECYVVILLSCVAWLSRTFSTFLDNQLGHVYVSAWVSRFASVTEIIKYIENLLLFACFVFSRTLRQVKFVLADAVF